MEELKGILYLVATPIGNLEDITLRALNILKSVDLIAAEDTRHTLNLLNYFQIKKPLISYYKEKENIKSEKLVQYLLNGKNIAIVSDAGTPIISDPGEVIVKKAIENDIKIISIPGACAAITALVGSGMKANEFLFIGFLPANKSDRKNKLDEIKENIQTMIFYEAPHKLINMLQDMLEIFGNRKIAIAREITKVHEEYIRGTITELLEIIKEPKGEFVIIVEGACKNLIKNKYEGMSLEEHFNIYREQGLEKKEIIKKIAKDRNKNKNEIYQYFINK